MSDASKGPSGWSAADIEVINDPLSFIRRHPEMLVGKERPVGRTIASLHAEALIFTGITPFTISYVSGWWVITSERDWIKSNDFFFKMIPFPEWKINSCRPEILVRAFADYAVTGRSSTIEKENSGLEWLSGHMDSLPPDLDKYVSSAKFERILAFRIAADDAYY